MVEVEFSADSFDPKTGAHTRMHIHSHACTHTHMHARTHILFLGKHLIMLPASPLNVEQTPWRSLTLFSNLTPKAAEGGG